MNEILKAIYDALNNAASLSGIKVYDHVPQEKGIKYPYIRYSYIDELDEGTDTEIEAFTLNLQFSVFSRERGNKETVDIQKKIYDILHRTDLGDTTSYSISFNFQTFQNVRLDNDGITRHGVQRYKFYYEKLPA